MGVIISFEKEKNKGNCQGCGWEKEIFCYDDVGASFCRECYQNSKIWEPS